MIRTFISDRSDDPSKPGPTGPSPTSPPTNPPTSPLPSRPRKIPNRPRKKRMLDESEEKLLVQIYKHWPRCTKSMTNKTAMAIKTAIGDATVQQIKTTYKKRTHSRNNKLRTADYTLKGFTPAEELILALMYKHWPRRVTTLTKRCKEILIAAIRPKISERLLVFIYTHRDFRRKTVKLPNKLGMTDEEESMIEDIYKHWPKNARKMTPIVATFLSEKLKTTPPIIQDSFKNRKWSRKASLTGDMSPRIHAAILAQRMDLFHHYVNDGDDINAKNKHGLTPLMLSLSAQIEYLRHLLGIDTIDLLIKNNEGQNILIYACALRYNDYFLKISTLLQYNKKYKTLDINDVDDAKKSMLVYACDTWKRNVVALLLLETTLKINQLFSNKTILITQCERQRNEIVKILLTHPKIDVSGAISIIADHSIRNIMIRKQVENQSGSSSSSSSSTTNKGVKEECGHYSMNQGQTGICYIIAVITLFRNVPELLKELKSNSTKKLRPIIQLLTTDYSTFDFSKQCPSLPPSMIQAVTNNRVTRRGALTKNGGSAFTLLLFILNNIDVYTDINVQIFHYDGVLTAETLEEVVQQKYSLFWKSPEPSSLGYIDLGTHILLRASFLRKIYVLCMACPHIHGFVFRVVGQGVDHVIAASVCVDTGIHICNSWGKGCQTDLDEVVRDLTANGALTILNIAFMINFNLKS